MSQPGWYPDPYGTGSLRWWDGRNWTERLNPEPDRPPRLPPRQQQRREPAREEPATTYAAPHAQPTWDRAPSVPALDVTVRGMHLYADDTVIAYGNGSLTWPRVEWVAYWAAERPAGSGHAARSGSSRRAGSAPRRPARRGGDRAGRRAGPGRRARDRLGAADPALPGARRAAAGCGAGAARPGRESVDVAYGLTVHPGGVRGNRVSLSWSSISGATVDRGRVWIQQASSSSPILYVPQQNPNAVLIPALLARLKG